MANSIDDEVQAENEQMVRRKKTDSGESDQAGSGVSKLLTKSRAEKVVGDRRILVGAELLEAIVEFVSEALVASASLVVEFAKGVKQTASSPKSFAVTNWFTDLQKNVAQLKLHLVRLRGADANGLRQKKPGNFGIKPGLSPTGPGGVQ